MFFQLLAAAFALNISKNYTSYHDSMSFSKCSGMQYLFSLYIIKDLKESQASSALLYRHVSEIGMVLSSPRFVL